MPDFLTSEPSRRFGDEIADQLAAAYQVIIDDRDGPEARALALSNGWRDQLGCRS